MLKDFLIEHYDEVLELLDCLRVGVYITDGNGTTLMVNEESCKTGGLAREEVTGRNMRDLEREGYVRESVTMKVLASGQDEVMIQGLGDGGRVFCSSHPVYKGKKISLVVTTEKDITETHILRKLLRQRNLVTKQYEKELEYLRLSNIQPVETIIAQDERMRRCVEQAKRVAALDTTVLLTGESGTGKEVIANLIYSKSNRAGQPFIKVNCAAIPENLLESEMFGYAGGAFTGAMKGGKAGYFELANGGTLFLDEIGEMAIHLQTKLLRALQDRVVMPVGGTKAVKVDVRLIAASNIDLDAALKNGSFREDLYYRLAVMVIDLPPLRERHADIGPLAACFLEEFNKKYALHKQLEPGAVKALERYPWPGNARELQNVIERCMISFGGDAVTAFQVAQLLNVRREAAPGKEASLTGEDPAACLAEAVAPEHGSDVQAGMKTKTKKKPLRQIMDDYERQVLLSALHQSKNASEASKMLGIDKSTMSRHMRKHGIV
jgi:PAS domain S-box-containing protein